MTDDSIIQKRLEKLREAMRKKQIDAVLVTKKENYLYLSGFSGTSAYLVITDNDASLITDFRYAEQAEMQAPAYEIVQFRGSIISKLNDIIESKKIQILAYEELYMTVGSYNEFKEKLKLREFIPIGGIIEELRWTKDHAEIHLIKEAVKIADHTFEYILKYIRPGIAEVELAAEMEYFMKRQGASGPSFETIVASGNRSAMPHGIASEKKLEMGDTVVLDYGAIYNGYCSDITRTVFLGQPSKEMKKIYGVVLEAQLKSIDGIEKDLTGREVDWIARDIIVRSGYGDNFGHGLGHGVGLEIHEEPRLSMTGNLKMKDGMVVTVEPGIYINRLGGVRIEDVVVVGNDRPLVLTSASKKMIVI